MCHGLQVLNWCLQPSQSKALRISLWASGSGSIMYVPIYCSHKNRMLVLLRWYQCWDERWACPSAQPPCTRIVLWACVSLKMPLVVRKPVLGSDLSSITLKLVAHSVSEFISEAESCEIPSPCCLFSERNDSELFILMIYRLHTFSFMWKKDNFLNMQSFVSLEFWVLFWGTSHNLI